MNGDLVSTGSQNETGSKICETAICKFCDKAISEPRHFVELVSGTYPVCCPGCRKGALDRYGLIDAVTCDAGAGNNPENPGSISILQKAGQDKIKFEGSIKCFGNNHFSISVIVPDIRCAACTWLIEKNLLQLDGIESVNVNLSEKRVHVQFNQKALFLDIVSLVESLGYTVNPDETDGLETVLKEERRSLLSRLGVAGIGMMQVMMFAIATYVAGEDGMDDAYAALFRWASLALATPVALYSASIFHLGAFRDLRNRTLGMDVPVSLAILTAYFLSLFNTITYQPEVYFDSVCMFTFFLLVGRYIEAGSRSQFQQSRNLTEHLVPALARISMDPDEFTATSELMMGSVVHVEPGEPIPVDGLVIEGKSSANESAFTGEVHPVPKSKGDRVLAGSVNLDGALVIEMLVPTSEFVINRISELYKQSVQYKPPFSIVADRIARYFVGSVLALALLSGLYWYLQGSDAWFLVSLTVLVVSCPCALSLATPIAYTIAATTLRRHGIVVSHGAFLERLAGVTSVAFDKTGTLTEGNLEIVEVQLAGEISRSEAMGIAASLEKTSKHPLSLAFGSPTLEVERIQILPGEGVLGFIEGREYRLGKASFALQASCSNPENEGMWVLLASDKPLAWFRYEDRTRDEAPEMVRQLSELGCKTSLLTGDQSQQGVTLGRLLDIDEAMVGLSPQSKVDIVSQKQQENERVLMVGDGINDTAAMGIADVSVAVSPVDVFVQTSADATLLSNNLMSLVLAMKYARRVKRIISENISWAVAYNICVIPLAVAGILEPWMAALGMSLSSVMVVLNSNRLIRV